jgi:hypothetical protein
VTAVAAMLRKHFPFVVTERSIHFGNVATEIDVAVLGLLTTHYSSSNASTPSRLPMPMK